MKTIITILHILSIAFMNLLSKFFLALLLPLKLNVRYRNLKAVYSTRGPFLMLPNHTNQWDPFILSFPILRPIRWVASDAAFRDTFKFMMYMGGAIPKVKEQSDMITLQELKKAVALRHIGGIFPEGTQNWDGRSGELIPATAKLVRFLKVPVIVPVIKGGYLTKPRWTWGSRRCRIEVHFRRIIDAAEIKTIKLAEIERRIGEALTYDEYEWQKVTMAPIHSKRRAEHLELAHWACPSCEGIGTLSSEGNTLSCNCGYSLEVDRYGFFLYPGDGPSFAHPADWISWQNNMLIGIIREKLEASTFGGETDPVILRDSDVILKRGARAQPMQQVHSGEARLYRDRIEVGDIGREIRVFPLKETTAGNTFKQQKFEFRFEKAQYRFRFPNRSVSGYKWEIAYKGLRQELVERGEW